VAWLRLFVCFHCTAASEENGAEHTCSNTPRRRQTEETAQPSTDCSSSLFLSSRLPRKKKEKKADAWLQGRSDQKRSTHHKASGCRRSYAGASYHQSTHVHIRREASQVAHARMSHDARQQVTHAHRRLGQYSHAFLHGKY
jgi:hypothetical protein